MKALLQMLQMLAGPLAWLFKPRIGNYDINDLERISGEKWHHIGLAFCFHCNTMGSVRCISIIRKNFFAYNVKTIFHCQKCGHIEEA